MDRDTHVVKRGQEHAQHERCSQSHQASAMSVVCLVSIRDDAGALARTFLEFGNSFHR